jgi:O-antigen ligase
VSTAAALPSRRERFLLAALSLSPLGVFLVARLLGYVNHLKLAGIACAGLGATTVLFLRPSWGLWLLVFYVYSGVGLFLPLNAATPLTAIVFAAVLLELVRRGDNRLDDPAFWYANAFFLLVALQSMLFARDPALSFRELGGYGKMLLVTYLIVQLVRTPDDLRRLAQAVFAGAVATVVLGVAIMMFGVTPGKGNYIGEGLNLIRFAGAHENPNRAAAFMCSALPLGLFAVKYCRHRLLRVAYVVAVLALIVGIFWTFSRSVVVPFSVVLVAVAVRELRGRRSWVSLLALIALGILLTPRYYWERVSGLREAFASTTIDWSVYTRLLALRTAWELFLQHPLTGVGLGNFIVASAYKVFLRIVVHNSYLEILVGTGVFGLAAFLGILWSGVRHALAGARHRWRSQPEWTRSLAFYFALSAISICLSAFFGTMPFRYPMWVPVAAGLVIGNLLRADRGVPEAAS